MSIIDSDKGNYLPINPMREKEGIITFYNLLLHRILVIR